MSDSEADSIGGWSVISLSPSSSKIKELYHLDTDDDEDIEALPGTHKSRGSIRTTDNNAMRSNSEKERFFLDQVFKNHTKNKSQDWLEICLDDFHIHRIDEPKQPVSLHKVASHNHKKTVQYAFSGTARYEDGSLHDVGRLEIISVQIGNFGGFDDKDQPITSTCNNALYLQTRNSQSHNCYYLLQVPSKEYAGMFTGFKWLATLAKHVNDYTEWKAANGWSTHLEDFRQSFSEKLNEWHSEDHDFQEWTRESGGTSDFRRHLVSAHHAEFIYDQIHNINEGDNDSILSHSVWTKAAPQCLRDTFNYSQLADKPTFVTSFVQKSFLETFPKWENRHDRREALLVASEMAPEVLRWRDERSARLGLGQKSSHDQSKNFEEHDNHKINIAALLRETASLQKRRPLLDTSSDKLIGKAVIVRTGSECKYAYVHGLTKGGRNLNVRWLLLASQTVCEGRMAGSVRARPGTFYPIGNELFYSDECCCDTVPVFRVVAVHSISILQDHSNSGHDFFVHRQYDSRDLAVREISEEKISRCYKCDSKHTNKDTNSSTSTSPTVHTTRKGQILSLFTGCGLMDSGFERGAGGVFETVFAADCDLAALASFEANHPNPQHCEFHNQDVNVLFQEFMSGKRPLPDVQCLIAGCPCQGFSILNSNRNSDKARKNCTMAAQTIAWIDLLRPEMVLIENVKNMDPVGPKSGPSAAGQCISTLVAMGYQARIAMLRASDYGGPTSRQRLFIIATIPGISLPREPSPSHGADQDLLPLVTASMATLSLPRIDNFTTCINPRQPDHVPYLQLAPLEHSVVTKIPTALLGSHNNLSTVESKLNSPAERAWYAKHNSEQTNRSSGSWCRVHPNRPMGTIVTRVNPRCARSGKSLHWLEHRLCSLQEYRLFHGVPDDYVLVGSREQQIHQLGNSVAWATGNVLGGMFSEA